MAPIVSYAVEGWTDEAVVEALLRHVGCEPWHRFTAKGKGRLDPRLPGYNRSAQRQPWIVLRDLDDDAPCAPDLVNHLIGRPSALMALRVPVRQSESWLLADRTGIEQFFSIPAPAIPLSPDELSDAKVALVSVCRRSRRAGMRRAMVPVEGGGRKVGPEYEAMVREFVETVWDPARAVDRSPSLDRTITRLRVLAVGAWA